VLRAVLANKDVTALFQGEIMRIIAASTAIFLTAVGLLAAQVRPTDPGAGRSVTIAVVRDGPMPEDFSTRV